MPASKAEQVPDALKALLETLPNAVVERNSVVWGFAPARGGRLTTASSLVQPRRS